MQIKAGTYDYFKIPDLMLDSTKSIRFKKDLIYHLCCHDIKPGGQLIRKHLIVALKKNENFIFKFF